MEEDHFAIAIEIGSIYSGIAFTTRVDFLTNPTLAFSPRFGSLNTKCRTCLLFDSKENFHSFGEEAEEIYECLINEGKHRDWLFFCNFSSEIKHDQILDENFTLKAQNQQEMNAKTVISTFVANVTEKFFESYRDFLPETINIRSIFVVHSLWNNSAKEFIKACGIQAGLQRGRISVISRTEAVTLHAKHTLSKLGDGKAFSSDKIQMVIDVEDGSIDTALFEILSDGSIREYLISSDKDMAFEKITDGFYDTVEHLIGKEKLDIYKAEFQSDLIFFQKEFKRKIGYYTTETGHLKLYLPVSFRKLITEELQNLETYKDRLKIKRDKCCIAPKEVNSYLDAPVADICQYIRKALSHPKGKMVKVILLVGGFSEFGLFREKMCEQFPDKSISVVHDASMAALRGAVIYGFNPKITRERESSFTYGYAYVFRKEQERECSVFDGKVNFNKIVSIGTLIEEGKQLFEIEICSQPDNKCVTFFFYASTEKNPQNLQSESTFFIGSNSLELDQKNVFPYDIKLSISFTETLMEATICNLQNHNASTVYLNSGYKLDTDEYEHVAAIDFGTTYSGFAYLSKHDYKRENGKHNIVTKTWTGGSLLSFKTPTSILFNPKGEVDSFGFEAEDKYSELVGEFENSCWSFFRRFKMQLYEKMSVSGNFMLTSENGIKMQASEVFAAALKYMKRETIDDLRKRNAEVPDSYIQWVVTVPAIWTDAAKSFMRQCAVMADIDVENLKLVLEPEAAALYVQMSSSADLSIGRKLLRKGIKYIVCDAGGGTIDTTVHEIIDEHGRVRELYKASGGDWGGTTVDETWIKFLEELLGKEAIDEFRRMEHYDILDLYREFEVKKRSIKDNSNQKIALKIPASLVMAYQKYSGGKSLSDACQNNKKYGNNISARIDKIFLNADLVKGFFQESLSQICEHLKSILQHPNADSVDIIFLVGGYAECPLLQSAVKKTFPTRKVIIPSDAGLAVLKGAVLFGHNPSLIYERIAKYTYGIAVCCPFQKDIHEEKYAFTKDGKIWCRNIFDTHVKVGEKIRVGESQSSVYYSTFKDCDDVEVQVYASTFEDPEYVTEEECSKIGSIKLFYDKDDVLGDAFNKIKVNFSFGGTEIEIKVECIKTGKTKTVFLKIE